MNKTAFMDNLVGNGSLYPNQLLKAFMGSSKGNPVDMLLTGLINTMYNSIPEKDREQLFIEDPRRSEKQKAVAYLIEKSASTFVQSLSESDLNLIFDKIQTKKDN